MTGSNAGALLEETVARFLPDATQRAIRDFVRCFDAALIRRRWAAAGITGIGESDAETIAAYFERPDCRAYSPNALFDEAWYLRRYPDVAASARADCISGFAHFIVFGLHETRWPSAVLDAVAAHYAEPDAIPATFDPAEYLASNAAVRTFLDAFPVLTPLEHYTVFGRFLHLSTGLPDRTEETELRYSFLEAMESEFDPEFYAARYAGAPSARREAFQHYLEVGITRQYSPNAWFEEDWYRAFYPDVDAAIPEQFTCGFEHYLSVGRNERRLPHFDLQQALEVRMPGVTDPIFVARTLTLRRRFFSSENLRASRRPASDGPPVFWFLIPTLNPDIAFGGYRACFEIMFALRKAGARVAIYCTQDKVANMAYFLWRQQSDRLRDAFAGIEVISRDEDERILIGPDDRIIAYTVLDLNTARALARRTDRDRPYLLTQEYETIFFENSSNKALVEESYRIPHYPIVNSSVLLRFFQRNGIGAFAEPGLEAFRDYAVFEHRINRLPAQSAADMRARSERILALYARPERHAARNLFELTVLALQNLCRRGAFGNEWSFVCLGALSDIPPIALGEGHRLNITARMSEVAYTQMTGSLDIGVSLMYAPHPGVVALEFATTGALVVTNVYENRSADELRALSANIHPCEPTLADLERAILEAKAGVADYESRAANAFVPATARWEDIFDRAFIEHVFGLPA